MIEAFLSFIRNKDFPCVAAKAAVAKQHIQCMIGDDMASTHQSADVLRFIYDFVDQYRIAGNDYHSAAVIFREPAGMDEELFDKLLWNQLQSFADLDAEKFLYDKRVDSDPHSGHFSFSLKEEAFFIIGLHPDSSRPSRRFPHPVIVFNPHQQFEKLRNTNHYEIMKDAVRKRDLHFSGSINPMLNDFGVSSEVFQYSGRKYDRHWKCPLQINHGKNKHNPSP